MATRYSEQQGSKSRQTKNIGNLSASRRRLWVRTTVFTAWNAASFSEFELQAEKTVLMSAHKTKSSNDTRSFLDLGGLHEDKLCGTFTGNSTDQCQNGSSKLLTPYRGQLRSTRIVVAYLRPTFSATKRTNRAPISIDK